MRRSRTAFSLAGLLLPLAVDAGFTTEVCFTVKGVAVPGALVRCFDQDWGRNDRVGQDSYTDSQGCVSVQDSQLWYEQPDIYCQIYANGKCFSTTTTPIQRNHPTNANLNFGTIDLPYHSRNCRPNFRGNGCGAASSPAWMREFVDGASGFQSQCLVHDACYETCGARRSQCDTDFYRDMDSTCMGRWACRVAATVFYQLVSWAGQPACRSARRRNECPSLDECAL